MEAIRMPFDGIVTNAVVTELSDSLCGGRINKIYQPNQFELLFVIRHKRTNYQLLFSIHPSYARFHLTERSFQNPEEPPMFCMILRKHLANAIVEKVEQYDLERIVSIHFKGFNEIGDPVTSILYIEIMGRHSNVVLVNENKTIIDCMKHVPPAQNRFRTLLPGATYKMPPQQNKLSLLENSSEQFIRRLDFNAGNLDKQVVQTVTGISPFVAKEFVYRAHLGAEKTYMGQYENMQRTVSKKQFAPRIYENKREDFHVLPIEHMKSKQAFSSVSEMLDTFFAYKAERDIIQQQTKDLQRIVRNEIKKNKRKIDIHEKTLKRAQRAEKWQRHGELLTAHLHLVKQGDETVRVVDYYDPEQKEIDIKLESDKSPSENAQRYFSTYKKLLQAEKIAQVELKKAKREIAYLESIIQQIEHALHEDLHDIREELEREGYIRKQKQRRHRRQKPNPSQFTSTDGTTIYIGRNNRQNEYVTHRIAHREDIWLHTKDIPGSHVIIKANDPSEQTLKEAAQLAAYFSKAQQSESVPVDYTKVKYVQKPTGAKPGFVIYRNEQTLFVTPSKELVEQLRVK